MIDQGNPLPNGTDSPVESCNPFLSMYCAVTRKDEHLKPEGGWHPQEAMTREEAPVSYTHLEKWYQAVICGKPVDNNGTYVDYLKQDKKNNCSRIVDKSDPESKRAELEYKVLDCIQTEEKAVSYTHLDPDRHL